MKVVAFNGSPRKDGNTFRLITAVLGEIEKEGIETELVQIGGKRSAGASPATSASKTRTSGARSRKTC